MSMYPSIRQYQIRSSKIVTYCQYQGHISHNYNPEVKADNMKEQRKKAYSGTLTKSGKKRMEKAITLLCQASPTRYIYNPIINRHHYHKLSFVTLTVSDSNLNRNANEVYKTCLRPLLQWLTKYKGVKLYVWKAELQKRGQIHYHLATPTFINYQELKNKWNYLQAKAGYLNGYYEKYKSYEPNSTDIHSMRKIKDAAAYLTKYFGKEEANSNESTENSKPETAKTVGKVWDCSANLKKAKYFTCEDSQTLDANIRDAVQTGKAYIENKDYFSIIYLYGIKPEHLLSLPDRMRMAAYLNDITNSAAA